ncbi:tRNA (adenosine(37)-N6)-dimethylallyltransferase MiaA [Polymorphobacter sp. PAMC 29334]|nr:tRNA (adenosine(37)-N6)-dimethylallyltransferase MiaA [Polymorphobacter sp. PAMC 29334]
MSLGRPTVVVIAGPTAAGKSAVALDFAQARGGTIINADASQVYADLRILSARPSKADEATVPHRLYGVIDGAEACDAARWAGMARAAIFDTIAAGGLPIVVGGSGMYLRILLDGIAAVPPIDPDVRAEVRALDPAAARAALAALDPAAAAKLADPQRVTRALEVVRSTRRRLADWQAETTGGIATEVVVQGHVVDLPRPALHTRIDARLDAMLAAGVLDEVAALGRRGLAADAPVMKALGVPPLLAHLRGEIELGAAIERTRLDTRHYAKRQQTWFRNQTSSWQRGLSTG